MASSWGNSWGFSWGNSWGTLDLEELLFRKGAHMLRQLGQLRPADTNAASLFSPSENKAYKIYFVIATNTSGASAAASIYHDVDGSTYDETTALVSAKNVSSNGYLLFQPTEGICDYRAAGNLGVKSSVANALTFTAYGEVIGENL